MIRILRVSVRISSRALLNAASLNNTTSSSTNLKMMGMQTRLKTEEKGIWEVKSIQQKSKCFKLIRTIKGMASGKFIES